MLPLTLLKTAENHPMLIELKNGDTYNGRLVSCNMFMNICLRDVICTSRDGDRFWKIPECYIRGNSIKYLRIPDEVLEQVSEEDQQRESQLLSCYFLSRILLLFLVEKFAPGRGGRGSAGRIGGRY
jgi:U6 snRNA-associated Sm-like protein LSm4